MSAKHSKMPLTETEYRIRRARKYLRSMSKEQHIDLMVKSGLLTKEQGEVAKQKLAEAKPE